METLVYACSVCPHLVANCRLYIYLHEESRQQTHPTARMLRSEDSLEESVLAFHSVGSRYQSQGIRFSSKHATH